MNAHKGLSLIELMITVAIMALLITVGAPAMQSVLQQNRVIAAVNDISGAVRMARFTAIDQEQTTLLCPTSDYKNCSNVSLFEHKQLTPSELLQSKPDL